VIAVIAILTALLLPAAKDARRRALLAFCSSNMHQMGVAMRLYINDKNGMLPPVHHFPPPNGHSYNFYQGNPRWRYSYWYHLIGFYAGDDEPKVWGGLKIFACPEVPSEYRVDFGSGNSYGYNFQFMTGTDAGVMVVQPGYIKLQPETAITKPSATISHVDAGYVSPARYSGGPAEDWAPQDNNPGFGDLVFPGNQAWPSYPGGTAPGRPVPMPRHISAQVNSLFFDGHVLAYPVAQLLRPRRGDPDCLHDNE